MAGLRARTGLCALVALCALGAAAPIAAAQDEEPPPPPPANLVAVNGVSGTAPIDKALTLSAALTAETDSRLSAYVGIASNFPGGVCPGTAPDADAVGQELAENKVIPPGSVASYPLGTFTPTELINYLVCAYLDPVSGPTVAGRASVPFTGRRPTATFTTFNVTPLHPATFVAGGQGRLAISATVEAARSMRVLVRDISGASGTDAQCAPTAHAEGGRGAQPIESRTTAATHSIAAAFTIPGTVNRVCAYVFKGMDGSVVPDDVRTITFNASVPTAGPMTLTPTNPTPVEDRPTDIRVQGSAQVPLRLTLLAEPNGTSCAPSAAEGAQRSGVNVLDGGMVGETGSFDARIAFRPIQPLTYLLCAYLGLTTDSPRAAAQGSVAVRPGEGALTVTPASDTPVQGTSVALRVTGQLSSPRDLLVLTGRVRECGLTARADLDSGGVFAVPGFPSRVEPGPFDVSASLNAGTAAQTICAYLFERMDGAPTAVASARITPVPPPPDDGGQPPGGQPPGGPPDPPGPAPKLPPSIGRTSAGGFYVNNTVLPAGITAGRFVELARRSGERWGYTFRGATSRGAAKRDGVRVVGFSRSVKTQQLAGIVAFQAKVRPKGCKTKAARKLKRCKLRTAVVERDVALARDLGTWWPGPAHPPADRMDLESVLLRAFGVLAGNRAAAAACSGTLLVGAAGVVPGWWWRDPQDAFRPGC